MNTFPLINAFTPKNAKSAEADSAQRTPKMIPWIILSTISFVPIVGTIRDWFPAVLSTMSEWSPEQWVVFFAALTSLMVALIGGFSAAVVKIIYEIRLSRVAQIESARSGARLALNDSPLPSNQQQMEQLTNDIAAKSANATAEIAATVARQAVTVTVPKVQT